MEGEVAIISVLADAWEVGVRDSQCQRHLNSEVFFTILSEDVCGSLEARNKKICFLRKEVGFFRQCCTRRLENFYSWCKV